MAATSGDAPAGLLSGVWSRLRAAASFCRWGQAPGGGGEENDAEEAAVRSRLARRAAAARRLGRKLAFLSFNLEVLVFVYAFWRARRRSLNWRLPAQALVIPALATLIYAAFVRFTRTLDLKDKKTLQRLQEENQQAEGEPREFDHNNQNNVQNCDVVEDASDSSVAIDSVPHTPKLRKHRHRDDGEADVAWGHSKDFQPAPSGGLRLRRLSSAKTYMTNNTATESSEEGSQKTRSVSAYSDQHVHVPVSTQDTVSYPSDDHSGSALSSMLSQPANIPPELPAGNGEKQEFDGLWDITHTCSSSSKQNLIYPAGPHNSFCDRDDSCSSEHAISFLSTAFQELLVKVNEEHSRPPPEKLEFSPVFKEAGVSPPDNFVSHSSLNGSSPDLSASVPPASETLKELSAGDLKEKALLEPHTSAVLQMYSVTSEESSTLHAVDDKGLIITSDVETYPLPPICSDVHDNAPIVSIDTVNPKWNLLLELYGNRVEETKSSKFHILEESTTPFHLEEVLLCPPSVDSIEHCLGTPELSLCSQETEKLEVAGSVNFINDNPELSSLSSPELVVEAGEDVVEKGLCELDTKGEHAIPVNMEEEALQDPLIVSTDTREQCLEASDVSLCVQDAKIREDFATANPELVYPASPELLAEGDEDIKEDKMSELHLPEQNDLPLNFQKQPILYSLVDDTAEHLLVTPLYSEEVEITEVHDVVKESGFESNGEEAFNHGKLVVTPSDDDSNNQYLTNDSIPVQLIPNTDINEALEDSQEASSEPLRESTCYAKEIFLSSGEITNEELFSSNSNSYTNVVEDVVPFAGQEGLSKFQEEMEVAGSVNFINDNPELSFLSSPELAVEAGEDVVEKELCELDTKEENAIPINMEEEALQDPLIVSTVTREQCLEASDVSLCIQDAKIREDFVTANPELVNPTSPELLAEGDEDIKEDKMPDLHLPEQNDLPLNFQQQFILDSLVDATAEHLLVTPLYCEEVEVTEVHDVVKESCFESEGEEAFNHGKLVVTPSNDDSNTQYLTNDSIPVQFIPNTDINEALEDSHEASCEPIHESTCDAKEIFLSSGEITNDKLYSSNSNSYANVVEDEVPFAGQEGLSEFQEEMPINFSDSPIFLDEVKSAAILDSDAATPKLSLQPDLHGGGVEENESSNVPEEVRTPLDLVEEILPSPVNNGSLFKQLKFICQSAGTPEFSLCNQESEEMEVAGSVSPELSLLSSLGLVADGGEDAREKGTGELNSKEENDTLISLETTDHCMETSEFSSSQGDKKTEVPALVSFVTVSSESNYPAYPELLVERGEDLKKDETSVLHLHEQKGLPSNFKEPLMDPLVVDTAEDALVTSELLICSEEVKMTKVHGDVKEVFSESEDEGAFDHGKLVLTSPDDDSTAQNLISNSIPAQFLSDVSVMEASQAGEEAPCEPPHESTYHSEGTFLYSDEINHDKVKFEAPFSGQEGLPTSEDEIVLTSLDTSVLLEDVRSAENVADNSGSSQSIPDSNQIQSLHDNEQAPYETLQEVTSLLEGSHTSSDEGINSEIFSLYSRSSSCVSEINMLESLRGGTSSEPQNDRDLSFDERKPARSPNMDSAESNTDDPVTAEFILEPKLSETLNASEESTVGSPHIDSSNFLGSFVAPDVINDMTESDKHLDLSSSSFAPVIDAFESLETGQGFSELQSENPFTVQETPMSPKKVNNAGNYFTDTIGDPQDSERTTVVALLDEDLTLHRAYMSPDDVSDDYASDFPHSAESHCISQKMLPESQDPTSSEEILVYPDEGSNVEPWCDPQDSEEEDLTLHRASLADDSSYLPHTVESYCVNEKLSPESQDPLSSQDLFYPDEGSATENFLGIAYSPLCSTEVLAEPWGIAQEGTRLHDETMLGSENIYMVDQEANSENLGNNSGSLDIPDITMTDSLRRAEILSSEILYDGMFSFEGTLISLDGDNSAGEDSPTNSGSGMHTAQTNTTSFLGLQEGSFNPEDENAIHSIAPYEIGTEETRSSNCGNSSSASCGHDTSLTEAPQELPIDAGREKVPAKDTEQNDGESKDMKEDVKDLDGDHENNSVGTFG